MDQWLIELLGEAFQKEVSKRSMAGLEEIRLRSGHPMIMRVEENEIIVWPRVSQKMLEELLQRACSYSVYAYTEMIAQGFLTLPGGHRIGICGSGVIENNMVKNLTDISSVSIRIARDVPGCADCVMPYVHRSTLIVGPPGSGKTTLLRDVVRQLSDDRKYRIALADERGEIAACVDGTPQLCVGIRTDVLSLVPKAKAVMMLLRSMNPQWIAVDEITAPEDVETIIRASYCGTKLLATAHVLDESDLQKRILYRDLLRAGVFSQVIFLNNDRSVRINEVEL